MHTKVWGLVVALGVSAANAQPDGLRGACKLFVEQQLRPAAVEWGDFYNWTVVDNKDGTYSVGAKFTTQNGARMNYVTCIIRQRGKNFDLVKLSRLI